MPHISRLPAELLEEIFHYLCSIDDVHHFGRTCKAAFHVIQRQTVYNEIMRSVIGTSPQHRFDLSLSRALDLHREIVYHPILATQPGSHPHDRVVYNDFETQLVTAVTGECSKGPCNTCLPDARIHEILARYQGLRFLEDRWLQRQLDQCNRDLVSVDSSKDGHDLLGSYQTAVGREDDFNDGNSSPRLAQDEASFTSFNADQRGRFHCAVVSVWLLNEIRWVLTQFHYPSPVFTLQIRLLEVCKKFVTENSVIPIVEQLDRYAVFMFLYHHLLPVHGTFLADRCSSKLPLTFPSDLEKSSYYSTRFLQLFLLAGQTYLQPPDIIDLVVRHNISRKTPYPRVLVPSTTDSYQIPLPTFRFRAGLDYTSPYPASHHNVRVLMRNSVIHLNIIGRATIHQSEASINSHWVSNPSPTGLFNVVDDMSSWLKEKALVNFDLQSEYHPVARDIAAVFDKEWKKVWWNVWQWANSEDKASAKMERWRRVGHGEDDET
ncbi:hypothetical protein CC80DRAFT_413970 [Byssothecium circinans]|uniref:F-box domain-containing protein n=1 Tax=Byssothecium circinans TaxID=147558 RepID=A0A6A5TUH5_9PLEO|nr:hypothetical protein CC80DRAFT_413970 [Byssothecium circinans]